MHRSPASSARSGFVGNAEGLVACMDNVIDLTSRKGKTGLSQTRHWSLPLSICCLRTRTWRTDDKGVTFKWKDYRLDGAERYNRVMTLDTSEFIRRFLMQVLPSGFHRIHYYGFLTCQTRAKNIERTRQLLAVPLIPLEDIKAASSKASTSAQPEESKAPEHPCPCCGSNMRIIETFLRGQQPKHKPTPIPPEIRIDTS
jgi:hypothetical protein